MSAETFMRRAIALSREDVLSPIGKGCLEAVRHEAPQEGGHIEEGRLACGVRPDQHVEAPERLSHVPQRPEVQRLDERDGGAKRTGSSSRATSRWCSRSTQW
jgi:hypothetical protein